MWKYLEHINITLNGVVRVMRTLSRSEVVSLTLRKNACFVGQKKIVSSHCSIPFVTNQDGEIDPGVLLYVLEGVLPLLKV